jgi:hypothetical protein
VTSDRALWAVLILFIGAVSAAVTWAGIVEPLTTAVILVVWIGAFVWLWPEDAER